MYYISAQAATSITHESHIIKIGLCLLTLTSSCDSLKTTTYTSIPQHPIHDMLA
jgi:hypothetical protein